MLKQGGLWLCSTWALNAVLNVKHQIPIPFKSVTLNTCSKDQKVHESAVKSFRYGAGLLKILLW